MDEIVTPINVDRLKYYMKLTHFDEVKSRALLKGFTEGFDIGYREPSDRRDFAANIPITVGSEEELWQKIMKEVKARRFSGPFRAPPYDSFIQSSIGLVPKAGSQTRLIFHLSYNFGPDFDQKSLNFHTPTDFCSVKYCDLDYAIRTCLSLLIDEQKMKSGCEESQTLLSEDSSSIFFCKADLRSAFRILPILPSQRRFLLMMARNPRTGKLAYFSDNCLPFGSSISCARFQFFSDCLRHLVEHITGRSFTVTNYLDNFLFVGTSEQVCNNSLRAFLVMCADLGCPVSEEKTEFASTMVVFLGILLNGEAKWLAIPQDKILKSLNLIEWAIQKKKVTIKFVQRLSGSLNFLNKAIIPGRAFTRGMYDKLKLRDAQGNMLKQYHHVNLGSTFIKDCLVWKQFLLNGDRIGLCRPFIDVNGERDATELNFYTDSSLSRDKGMGGIFNSRWIVAKWGRSFIDNEKPSIAFLELYALTAAIITWGHLPQFRNSRIIVFCDNKSVRDMVNVYASGCPQCMKLVRILAMNGLKYNRHLFIKYVKSKDNILADALSRLEFNRFWRNSPPDMNQQPDQIDPSIFPVEKVWYADH